MPLAILMGIRGLNGVPYPGPSSGIGLAINIVFCRSPEGGIACISLPRKISEEVLLVVSIVALAGSFPGQLWRWCDVGVLF